MKECGVYVEGHGTIASFPCSLEQGHYGPHATDDVPVSKRKREQWSKEQSETLDAFQPEFQTTAQRLTENPTEHPDVVKQREQEATPEPTPIPPNTRELPPLSMVAPNEASFTVGTAVTPNGTRLAVLRAETVTGSQVYFFTPESFSNLHALLGHHMAGTSRLVVAKDLP
jgi:hypothetical protein